MSITRRTAATALAAAALAGAAGCSSSAAVERGWWATARSETPLSATQPYVVATGARSADLVWPSGNAWIVLRTDAGFRAVANRTPIGVETDGGLVGAFAPAASGTPDAVAVGATGLLYRSPLLLASGTAPWRPAELPGAIVLSRGAVAVQPGDHRPTAVVRAANGTVVEAHDAGWRTLTTGRRLDPRGSLHLDSVTWLTRTDAVVTGHDRSGRPVAYRSGDGGATWQPVGGLPQGAVVALAPCLAGGTALLPVLTGSGTETVLRSSDDGRTWTAGQRFGAAPAGAAWGCNGTTVWAAGAGDGAPHILVSTDLGSSWHRGARAPAALTSLALTPGGSGYATSGGARPELWTVSAGARSLTRVALPGWVAGLGQQMSTS